MDRYHCSPRDHSEGSATYLDTESATEGRNSIVERSPTMLFRLRGEPSLPLIYVSHNVSHVWL